MDAFSLRQEVFKLSLLGTKTVEASDTSVTGKSNGQTQ